MSLQEWTPTQKPGKFVAGNIECIRWNYTKGDPEI